jgi:hypothetical protein
MNAKQIILVFMMFFIMLLIITIPLWLEGSLPYLKEYMHSAVIMVNNLSEILDRTSNMLALEYKKRF